jgi:hypothetical protein
MVLTSDCLISLFGLFLHTCFSSLELTINAVASQNEKTTLLGKTKQE